MSELKLTIHHGEGLHARPASQLVKTCQQFKSKVSVHYNDRSANGKSLLSILTLGVFQGAEITIRADGEDESQALQALEVLVNRNFGE